MSEPDILHEERDALSNETVNRHRAIRSLMEEFEAIDWYAQRVEATDDPSLKEVLAHNRDEEKEHAAMVVEWLRRNDAVLDRYLRQYLFSEGSIVAIEEAIDDDAEPQAGGAGSASGLGIGSLRDAIR